MPLVKPMALESIFLIIFLDLYIKNTLLHFIYIYFILCFSNILHLYLSDLTFASDREGIDNPFIALGASLWLFVQVLGDLCVLLLLDWYLGSLTKGNTYLYFAASPFPLQGKNQRKLKK